MKKTTVIVCLLSATVLLVFLFLNRSNNLKQTPKAERYIKKPSGDLPVSPPAKIQITAHEAILAEKQTNNENAEAVICKFENLEDLKQIKSLQKIDTILGLENWCSERHLIQFKINGQDGKSVLLNVIFLTALVDSTNGRVRQLALHTQDLEIKRIREVGLQLNVIWGLNSNDFIVWCDQVGNEWLDAPLFSSKAGKPTDPNQTIGYGIHRTFDNEKPWFLELLLEGK